MFDKIAIDCLNLIFTFGTAREMGNVMSSSKKCRAIVRKCDHAWYELYIRLYKTANKDHDKHDCEYTIDCLGNPHKKQNPFSGRERTLVLAKIQQAAKSDDKYSQYRLERGNYRRHDRLMYAVAVSEFHNRDSYLAHYADPQQIRQKFDELCKIMKFCVNPTHTKLPVFDPKKNFRRELRILFINHNKKIKFTKTDEKKMAKLQEELEALQRKKRIAELVADYE